MKLDNNNNPSDFESSYINVRSKENRVYSDKEVLMLPNLDSKHPQQKEWLLRQDTLYKFEKYINSKKAKTILDIGCGNGWFSNKMANQGHDVLGIDINKTELEQAERLFKKSNLNFKFADVFKDKFDKKFDLITFNASVQYFENIQELMLILKSLLSPQGEVHILDSPIYETKADAEKAKGRSIDYFMKMNTAKMSNYYFHHCKHDFEGFAFHYQKKNSFLNKLTKPNKSPFPWLTWTCK